MKFNDEEIERLIIWHGHIDSIETNWIDDNLIDRLKAEKNRRQMNRITKEIKDDD